jgi:hypothetical protein
MGHHHEGGVGLRRVGLAWPPAMSE